MATFEYKARNRTGREIVASIEAASRSEATEELRRRELLILDLRELSERSPTASAGSSRWHGSPRSVVVEIALRQLGVMLRSGLTLLEAIRTAARQSNSTRMQRVLLVIADRIQAGESLESALAEHRCFGRLTVSLVRVGEQTGELDDVLIRASESLERRRLLQTRLVGALLYPAVVVLAAIGATLFMLTFAIPRISDYLGSSGRELPAMTRWLVNSSDFLLIEWPTIVGVLTLAAVALLAVYKTPAGRLVMDRMVLRVPLIGDILRTSVTAGLSRALEQMIRSGITIVESLETACNLTRNARVQQVLTTARGTVLQGGELAPSLTAPGVLKPMLPSMVAVGEQSGTLEQVLRETAEFHEQRLASMVQMLSTAVEVAVVIVVGGIVGFVYIAFMLALYKAATP